MKYTWLYALLTGTLLSLSFPPSHVGWISLVAYVPLLLVITRYGSEWSRLKSFALGYVTFFVYHLGSNWWISSWQENTDPYLLISGLALDVFHPVFLAAPFWVLMYINNRIKGNIVVALAPFAVAGFEWLHGQTDASYPWLSTGYALIDTPLAQAADVVGVYGLSFFVLLINALIVFAIVNLHSKRIIQRTAFATIGVLAIWLGYGLFKQNESFEHETQSPLNVLLIQPNEDPWNKWADPREQVNTHIALTNKAISQGAKPDVVVWSETAIPYTILDRANRSDWIAVNQWVRVEGFHLLTGFADRQTYKPGTAPPSARYSAIDSTIRFDSFNAAMLIAPESDSIQIHRKSALTPFAERLPFADQLAFAMSWIEWGVGISAWGKGSTRIPLSVVYGTDTARIAPIICIESIYPEVAQDFVSNGANVLCVITNDAWYDGTPGPRQHYCIARMRAIEQRRWCFRVGNSGITGIINSHGNSVVEVQPETRTTCSGQVRLSMFQTVYSKLGNVLAYTSLFLTLITLVFARIPAMVRKMQVLNR